ncbi:hypothetical protein ABZP36_020889 [Zizania latifolia]
MRPAATKATTGKEKSRKKGGAGEQLLVDQVSSLRARLQDALGLAKSDGCGSKKWQTTDAGIQSHALKAATAFLGCLSNDMLRLPHIKVYLIFVSLCGYGAMILLKNEELMAKIGELIGKSHPCVVRIEALKLCQILLRFSKGCDLLMAAHCQPIIEGTINAMSRGDERLLMTEGCRTAFLVLRYAGSHHRFFWPNAIDDILYNILIGSCISSHKAHQIILGNLAVHCNNEYLSVRKGQDCVLLALIYCVWREGHGEGDPSTDRRLRERRGCIRADVESCEVGEVDPASAAGRMRRHVIPVVLNPSFLVVVISDGAFVPSQTTPNPS